jgi:hypothetical protein
MALNEVILLSSGALVEWQLVALSALGAVMLNQTLATITP